MTTGNHDAQFHPPEQLEAYALDALDEDEAARLEFHLNGCSHCSLAVAQLQSTAAQLGEAIERLTPPQELQARLMRALEPSAPTPVYIAAPRSKNPIWAPVARFLLPVAAAIMVGLFSVSVVMNARLSDRTDTMERENATLTAGVALSDRELASMADTVRQLQAANYWLANPGNQPLALRPPDGAGESKGMLLVADDGRGAVILLSGMDDSMPSSTYEVWLMRGGDRVLAGTVEVDAGGWGSTTIQPEESVFGFAKVEVVTERSPGVASGPDDMVLEADIQALLPSQMVSYPNPW